MNHKVLHNIGWQPGQLAPEYIRLEALKERHSLSRSFCKALVNPPEQRVRSACQDAVTDAQRGCILKTKQDKICKIKRTLTNGCKIFQHNAPGA